MNRAPRIHRITQLPVALRMSAIIAYLEQHGEADAPTLALHLGVSSDRVRALLLPLKRQGLVTARLESVEEAAARARTTPRSVFTRRLARRRIRFTLTPQR